MGQIVTIEYIDDLDGIPIDSKSLESVEFSYRGRAYTLDLSKKNAAQFDRDMARYIAAATRSKVRQKPAARRPKSSTASKSAKSPRSRIRHTTPPNGKADRNRAIRDWAAHNGHTVAARGRIPAAVVEAFDAVQ